MAKERQSRADQLEERLIDFAVRIVKLSAHLPKTSAGRHVAAQILRSGTSPAPNYGEARGGESAPGSTDRFCLVIVGLRRRAAAHARGRTASSGFAVRCHEVDGGVTRARLLEGVRIAGRAAALFQRLRSAPATGYGIQPIHRCHRAG